MGKLDLKKENAHLFKINAGEIKEVECKNSFYITLDGSGSPNVSERYQEGIGALYKLAYTIKFHLKEKGMDFVIMPLSTLWWTEDGQRCTVEGKEAWKWTMMIEIPDFITEDEVEIFKCRLKNENELMEEISYNNYNEGDCIQTLHIGAYDEENELVDKLHSEIKKRGYELNGKHHEIYLNDPRKVQVEKLKTIIRQPIKKKNDLLSFKDEVSKLFENIGENKTMVLSTSLNDRVTSRNMSIIIDNNKFYFQSDVKFEKGRQIESNKLVALCSDNIQIEGRISSVSKLNSDESQKFKVKFKKYHRNSYDAYSRLIDNRVYEVEPILIKRYCYEEKNVFIKYIDFNNGRAYKEKYLTH